MRLYLFLAALFVAFLIAPVMGALTSVLFIIAAATILNRQQARCCATLSVPEIMMDVLAAFKTEIPFMLSNFSTDFSSKTAVKGDKITAHISSLPVVQTYDPTTGFAYNAATADSLLTDVSVTLSSFNHVPIKVPYLTQLASKKPLYKEAIRNYGYVLAKKVVDDAMATIVTANFTNAVTYTAANTNMTAVEAIRTQCNAQKMARYGRFGIVNSAVAATLQGDQTIASSLFYGQLNGDKGYRQFTNVAGFGSIWEYPDMPTNGGTENISGFFADPRAIVIANRRVDFANVADDLGIPQVMQFYPISDPATGLEMTGVAWQQPGTGDVYVSAAVLYGISAGKMGANGGDAAGLRLKTA